MINKEILDTLKKDWFSNLLTLSGTSLPDIKRDVQEMVRQRTLSSGGKAKKFVSYDVSATLIKNASLKAGGIGALASSTATIPFVGTVGTILLSTTFDLGLLMRLQIELCYGISVAYNVDIGEDELKAVTMALLGFSGSAQALKGITAGMLRKMVDEMAEGYLKAGVTKAAERVSEMLIPRLLRGAYRFIPLLGIPLGASINIASTMTVGNQARKYFSMWDEPEDLHLPTRSELKRMESARPSIRLVKDGEEQE